MYDYLIVGSGFFGSTFAQQATEKGYKCLIIDKRNHNAGNAYTEEVEDINVHKYGPHIFHTSDEKIWSYVNRFTKFNNFIKTLKSFLLWDPRGCWKYNRNEDDPDFLIDEIKEKFPEWKFIDKR
jgi:choline dehydrogenase-like flavoprotein